MRGMKLVAQIVILYLFYRLGIFLQQLLDIPIPGSIIGMFLLLILLWTGIMKSAFLQEGSSFLLVFLPLFFVPATVGVINHLPFFFSTLGILLLAALIVSTILIMVCSGVVGQKVAVLVDNKVKDIKRGISK